LTTGRIAAAHERFDVIRQVAIVCSSLNTCFLGPTRVHNPNGIWSVQPILQGSLLRQTDRQTDRPTDHATRYVGLTIGRI